MEQKKDNSAELRNRQQHQGEKQLRNADYLLKKAEKLTTALYLVSDIMSEKEPMKWRLRESGVDLLSDVTVAATLPGSERMSILRNVMKRVDRVVSFLDITLAARMLSEMNITILKKEYLAFKDAVEAEWNRVHQAGKAVLGEAFFDVPLPPPVIAPPPTNERPHESQVAEQKVHASPINSLPKIVDEKNVSIKSHESSPEQRPMLSAPHVVNGTAKMTQIPHAHTHSSPERNPMPQYAPFPRDPQSRERIAPQFPHNGNSDSGRSDRRKIILALAKQKPAINVGDVARSIPGVSEKTIQRELLAMVAEGILKKKGERRWSTYSLPPTSE